MSHRAVLFDLDGTLLDTLEDLADSTNAAVGRLGFPPHKLAAYKYFVGDGIVNLARRALPEAHRDEGTVARCVALIREIYADHWADKTRPYPGIPELLDALAERRVPMAVVSNKPHDFTKLCVARLLPRWRFEAVVGVSDSVPPKPDPKGALGVAAKLELWPAHILYVGDTNTDMKTAHAAGMYPVGVLWGFRPADELKASGAKVLIGKPAQLLDLL